MIAAALIALVPAMLLVRAGWSGRRALAIGGWALTAAALAGLMVQAGAWGLAMGGTVGIVAGLAIVLHAGWTAPVRSRRPSREAPAVTLPRQPAEFARRVLVFVLVVPVAFAAAQWLAFGLQAVARAAGSGEADATFLMLFAQPVLWSVLMAWQMTQPGPRRMLAAPAGAAILGTVLWGVA